MNKKMKGTLSMTLTRLSLTIAATAVCAQAALAAEDFRHTITGEPLKVTEESPAEGRDTPAVKKFLEDGTNLYIENKSCLPKGEEVYLTACSGCHGHVGEGKLGPGLNDNYWTYPKNATDKGLFETIFGGAQGMMGPHNDLPLDETLKLIAWIRHIYTGDVAEVEWLTDEQKKAFKPYTAAHAPGTAEAQAETDKKIAAAAEKQGGSDDQCKASGG
jgi:cytochrome c-L